MMMMTNPNTNGFDTCHHRWMVWFVWMLLVLSSSSVVSSFVPHVSHPFQNSRLSSSSSSSSLLLLSATNSNDDNNILVISPPGGVGEVAAVKAACLGASVRWFVVSSSSSSKDSSTSVQLAPQALAQIQAANGSLSLAGATVQDLQQGGNAIEAVSKWCGTNNNGLVCTYDDCTTILNKSKQLQSLTTTTTTSTTTGTTEITLEDYQTALRLAALEASRGVSGPKVILLAANDDTTTNSNASGGSSRSGGDKDSGGFGKLVGSLFKNAPTIPDTFEESVASGNADDTICTIRYGTLFGLPESSPDFSPLVGGPKKDPVVTKEYTMRAIRMDPYIVSGNIMTSSSSMETSRHAVGQVAAYLATSSIAPIIQQPISITSQSGTDEWTLELWQEEFNRVQEQLASRSSGASMLLYSQDMIVDNTERLATWLETKWAPAVLRTYDIAAIRIGARPVYAVRSPTDPNKVEITWQQLVNFESVTVGKLELQVSETGVIATRQGGDPNKGFGAISKAPLPGEDVLVRSLAQATSQAMEKGLAKKVPTAKAAKVEQPVPVSSVVSSGTVVEEVPATSPPPTKVPETGPRQSGARRSTERKRRLSSKKKKANDSSSP